MTYTDILEKMKNDYLNSLPEKLEELKSLIDLSDYENLKNFFHKLKGSGATYGFPEISTYGQENEEVLKESPLNKDKVSESYKNFEKLILKIKTQLN